MREYDDGGFVNKRVSKNRSNCRDCLDLHVDVDVDVDVL